MRKLLTAFITLVSFYCCAQKTVFTDTIYFGSNSSKLSEPAIAKLKAIAPSLIQNKVEHISIGGHADRVGGKKYNNQSSCPLLFCSTNRFFKGMFSKEQRDPNL